MTSDTPADAMSEDVLLAMVTKQSNRALPSHHPALSVSPVHRQHPTSSHVETLPIPP
jgi:hypothetical protein